jgi:thiosulfate dehydrogenase (quinone) large subunit
MRSDMADVHSPHALGDSPAVVGEQPNSSSLHHGTVPRVSPDPHANSLVQRARSETVPVWVLLPLRAFMGFTFVFAGLQKLASRSFFTAGAPGSIQEQLQASYRTTPVRFLVSPALHAPVAFGIVIALAEIAVGLGVALGLLGRLAAAGGMLLSLLFFLTVSFNTWPYYYGSDIVFLFAWTPLLLAGSGPLSLDAVLQRSARKLKQPDDVPVEGDFGRRLLLRQAGAAGAVAACGLFLAGVTAAIGRATSKSTSLATGPGLSPVGGGSKGPTASTGSTPTSSGTSPGSSTPVSTPKGTRIGAASSVSVGGAASFKDPASGQPAYVVQPTAGKYVAFSAICTHLGCTVGFQAGSPPEFVCPCHNSIFNATTGEVIQGPAVQPLPQIALTESSTGELYADG